MMVPPLLYYLDGHSPKALAIYAPALNDERG